MGSKATSRSGNAELLERLAEAYRTFDIVGVLYADDAGFCYRVQQGNLVIGGDYVDAADAQAVCDRLNVQAILRTLRDHGPTEEMVEAGARINAPAIIDAPRTGNRGEVDAVEEMRSHCLTEADQSVRAALTNLIEASEK